jgi:C-terminal processing protease CtpA/Prc
MLSKSARWLAAASLLVLITTPALAASSTASGWLGVTSQPTDADLKKSLDLKQDGLIVNQVTRDGPAEKAGLRRGDVILTYNSRSVTTPEQLRDLVRNTAPGRSIALGIWRDGVKKTLDVKVGDVSDSGDMDSPDAPVPPEPPVAPRAPGAPSTTRIYSNDGQTRVWVDGRELDEGEIKAKLKDMKFKLKDLDDMDGDGGPGTHVFMAPMARPSRGRLGVRIDELNSDMGQALGVPSGVKGVLVTQVLEDTPAQKAGLRAGDVITRVAGDTVSDTDDLTRALRDRQGKVSLEVLRKGARRTVQVDLPSRESMSRNWVRFSEPGSGSWGFWRSKDSTSDDADLRREIDDLKKEIQELRDQMKSSKK